MKSEAVAQALIAELSGSDSQKSSHWQQYTAGRTVSVDGQIGGISGFGAQARRTLIHQAVHSLLQRRVLGLGHAAFSGSAYKNAVKYTRAQGRALDMDVLRHVCTMDLLSAEHSRMRAPGRVAVIGDGQTNFVSAALASGHYDTILSINLADVLLNDLHLLMQLPDLSEGAVACALTRQEVQVAAADPSVKVVLIPAHRARDLGDVGIDLAVNIASFQEMTPEIVAGYFDLIRANQAWHYNCNRLRKVLPAGEVLDFMSWDWEGAEIVLDELCPWHQRFYTYRPPLIRPYDGPIQHRLAKF